MDQQNYFQIYIYLVKFLDTFLKLFFFWVEIKEYVGIK